jgi:hypothetical protein
MKFQKVEGQFQDKKNRDQFDFFFKFRDQFESFEKL